MTQQTKGAGNSKHDQLVIAVTKHLKSRFYRTIRADTEGFVPPAAVVLEGNERIVPAVTAGSSTELKHIFDILLPEKLNDGNLSLERWSKLSELAKSRACDFWLVAPQGLGDSARSLLDERSISARVWEI